MNSTSLETKTIRPGSLRAYAQYYHPNVPNTSIIAQHGKRQYSKLRPLIMLVAIVALVGGAFWLGYAKPTPKVTSAHQQLVQQPAPKKPLSTAPAAPAAATPVVATNYCASNTLNQFALVSISQRHMWVCENSKTVYDSPVITGIDYLAADKTPTGTYHVYGKYTDLTLTGSDSTGSWSDPVSYWMPFLHNQYGSYGFHDATWRANSDFGNISPDSADASHGCVELPLATASWLYGWIHIGTTITIES